MDQHGQEFKKDLKLNHALGMCDANGTFTFHLEIKGSKYIHSKW